MSDDPDDDEMTDDEEIEAAGWDAIDAALQKIYGDQEPKHYGAAIPAMLGGNDPLTGISIYKSAAPESHFHYVTFGFTELYEKESEDPDFSGYGFELTFRLACDKDATDPPTWPLNFLQNLARYVFKTGNAFDERHHMTLNGPIALHEKTNITAILLIEDPELHALDTPNGHMKFLQIVGLCGDEYQLIQEGYYEPIASRVCNLSLLSVTDIHRASILQDRKTLDAVMASESTVTQTEIFGTVAEWTEKSGQLEIRIGATLITQLISMLHGPFAKHEPIVVYGKGSGIVFEPAKKNGWSVNESMLNVSLTPDAAADFAQHLRPVRGDYTCAQFSALKIKVVPIDIKDGAGKVIKTVG